MTFGPLVVGTGIFESFDLTVAEAQALCVPMLIGAFRSLYYMYYHFDQKLPQSWYAWLIFCALNAIETTAVWVLAALLPRTDHKEKLFTCFLMVMWCTAQIKAVARYKLTGLLLQHLQEDHERLKLQLKRSSTGSIHSKQMTSLPVTDTALAAPMSSSLRTISGLLYWPDVIRSIGVLLAICLTFSSDRFAGAGLVLFLIDGMIEVYALTLSWRVNLGRDIFEQVKQHAFEKETLLPVTSMGVLAICVIIGHYLSIQPLVVTALMGYAMVNCIIQESSCQKLGRYLALRGSSIAKNVGILRLDQMSAQILPKQSVAADCDAHFEAVKAHLVSLNVLRSAAMASPGVRDHPLHIPTMPFDFDNNVSPTAKLAPFGMSASTGQILLLQKHLIHTDSKPDSINSAPDAMQKHGPAASVTDYYNPSSRATTPDGIFNRRAASLDTSHTARVEGASAGTSRIPSSEVGSSVSNQAIHVLSRDVSKSTVSSTSTDGR